MRFLAVLAFLLLIAMYYLGSRAATDPWHWVYLSCICMFALLLPIYHGPGNREGEVPKLKRLAQQLTYLSMGLISSLFGLSIVRDLILFSAWAFGSAENFLGLASNTGGTRLIAASIGLTFLGFFRGWLGPRVRHVTVPIEGLPTALVGFKIAQISDLHIGPSIGRRYVEAVIRKASRLESDMTVLTGDILDAPLERIEESARLLSGLRPANRVFFALGNHEYYWGIHRRLKFIEDLGLTPLINEGVTLDHKGSEIWVAGISDPVAAQIDVQTTPSVSRAAEGGRESGLRILLSHRPHFLEEASREGFHLQLSGHTHGGQFFPWNFVARFFHKYFLGLMSFAGTWIYVNPGTGSWGPLIRMGTTPEITSLKLIRA